MQKLDSSIIVLLYYFGWFGAVYFAKSENSLSCFVFPFLLLSFLYLRRHLNKNVIFLSIIIAGLGMLFDFSMSYLGLISIYGNSILFVPTWLTSIWFSFSLSIVKLSLNFNPPNWIAVLLGITMGPLSYKSGEFFQLITFLQSSTLFIYALFWGSMFPLILHFSRRYQ